MRNGRRNNIENAPNSNKQKDDNFTKGISILNKCKDKAIEKREEIKANIKKKDLYYDNQNRIDDTYKFRPFVIGIIVVVIILLIFLFFHYGPILGISLNKSDGISDKYKIDYVSTDSDIYKSYNSELLIYSNQKLTTYNNSAKKTWEYKFTSQFTPNIYIKSRFMVVTNNSNGTIYLFENKKEILNTKIEGTIQDVFLDDNGNMAVEYSTSGYKEVIGVYSKNGKNMYNVYLSNSSIIDVQLLDNAKKLVVLQTNSSAFKIGFTISVVDGNKQSNNLKEIAKIDNNFVYNLTIQNQNLIILLDDKIVSCNINTGDTKTIKSFNQNQLLYVALYNNYYAYIEKEQNVEDGYIFKTERFDSTNISCLKLKNSPKLMENSGFLNYLIYQDKLQTINKWGIDIKNVAIDFPPKDIIVFNNEKSIALIYTNKIYIVKI